MIESEVKKNNLNSFHKTFYYGTKTFVEKIQKDLVITNNFIKPWVNIGKLQ